MSAFPFTRNSFSTSLLATSTITEVTSVTTTALETVLDTIYLASPSSTVTTTTTLTSCLNERNALPTPEPQQGARGLYLNDEAIKVKIVTSTNLHIITSTVTRTTTYSGGPETDTSTEITTISSCPTSATDASATAPTPTNTTGGDAAAANSTASPTSVTVSGSKSHAGAIAGGVVGGVAGIAIIAGLGFLLYRRRKAKPQHGREVAVTYANPEPKSTG